MARKRLDETLGSVSYEEQSAGASSVSSVALARGQGVLEQGTLLSSTAKGMMKLNKATAGKPSAVLAKKTDTGTGEGTVSATVYRSGNFSANKLIVADDYELTKEDKETLRAVGILINDTVKNTASILENATLSRARLGSMILGG